MTVLVPNLGVTNCSRAKSLLKNHAKNIVGSFWIMCGYGFSTENIPDWWIDIVLEDNQAAAIVDRFEQGFFDGEHENPLYLGFCIIVVADKSNPASLSYVIQHLRMWEAEGIELLKMMAQHNIPAHTEVTYPDYFLENRYSKSDPFNLNKNLKYWTVQTWEDYCSFLLAEHGSSMLRKYWQGESSH